MDIEDHLNKSLLREFIFSQKCSVHVKQQCDLLHLNKSTTQHRICTLCAKKNKIPLFEILSITQLLNSDLDTFLPSFPLLTDPELLGQIESTIGSVDEIIKQTDEYFSELQQNLNTAVVKAKSRTKIQLCRLSQLYQKMMDSFQDVSKIKEFQQIVLNSSNNNNNDILHDYIVKHCQGSVKNTMNIAKNLEVFLEFQNRFSTDQFKDSQRIILEMVQRMSFFESEEKCNVIKQENNYYFFPVNSENNQMNETFSNFHKKESTDFSDIAHTNYFNKTQKPVLSQKPYYNRTPIIFEVHPFINFFDSAFNLKIQKEQTGSTLLTNLTSPSKQCYIDMEISHNERYIIRLEIIHQNQTHRNNNSFAFGLFEESLKQSKYIHNFQMSYGDGQDGYGIDKIVKGKRSLMEMGQNSNNVKTIEFRIHLASRYLKVADFPEYSSIVELDDSSKINQGKKYYFGIYINWQKDQVRILEILKVEHFDRSMD